MKIEIDISDEKIRDAVESARIRYWGTVLNWDPKRMRLEIREDEDGDKICVVTREDFARGITKMATEWPHHFKDLVAGTGDQYTGDVVIQIAAFGEEKYA